MSLFSPDNLLWLLPFAGTLVLLYFLKPRLRNLEVPSIYLWRALMQSTRSDKPFQKLKISALLLFQLLALLLLIFILSRPFSAPHSLSRSIYVLVLDQSASMKATDVRPDRYAAACWAAEQFIKNNLKPGDKAALVGAQSSPVLLCPTTEDKSELLNAINSSRASDTALDMPSAMTFAHNTARSADGIIVFGDGTWSSDLDGQIISRAISPVHLVSVGKSNSVNAGIVELSERSDEAHPSAPPNLLVTVDRYNSTASGLSITLNNKTLLSTALPAGTGSITKDFPIAALRGGGLVTARLTGMEHDDLRADDVSSLVVRPDRSRKVLLVTDGNSYLERALALLPNVQLYEEKTVDYSNPTESFDLTVYDGWLPPSLPPGAALVFNALSSAMPVKSAGKPFQNPSFADWNETDPVLNYVDFSPIHVSTALNVRPDLWGTVVADFDGGPAIVKGTHNGRSVVWVGFSTSNSDLARQVAFPILLSNIVDTLSGESFGISTQLTTGIPIMLPSANMPWKVVEPDGETTDIPCSEAAGCSFVGTQSAGIYRAQSGSTKLLYACNVGSVSSTNIASLAHPALGSMSNGILQRENVRVNLAPWLAVAATIVMLAEWLIYHRPLRYTRSI
jgi:Ca-activated chloride channel family protein